MRSDGHMETSSNSDLAIDRRSSIQALEDELLKHEQLELPVEHFFSNFTYTRVLRMPAGSIVTGKIHRFECTNVLAKGRMRVVTEEDDYDIEAPYVFVSGPGIKKAFHVLEDSVFLTIHPWDGISTPEQIEQQLITPSYENLIEVRA